MTDAETVNRIAKTARRFDQCHWNDVVLRSDILPELSPAVFLHAGPPLQTPYPEPIRQSAAEAVLFEGLANDLNHALHLIDTHAVQLRPAQDHGIVTPLAQVVSHSMPLLRVVAGDVIRYAPMVESPPPALRFGKPAGDARVRLQLLSTFGLHTLRTALHKKPVCMAEVIEHALRNGEECHALTMQANTALAAQLSTLAERERHVILANPGFVLPVIMAACSALLANSDIVAAGGNGQAFGYRLHGQTDWQTIPATAPTGTRFPGQENTEALGAIGDSAVIDFCGLGAQALSCAPGLLSDWHAVLPKDMDAHRLAVLDAATEVVSYAALQAGKANPMVNLAILDKAAEIGLIGRGVYRVPSELFR